MKKKIDFKFIIIIVLIVVLAVMVFLVIRSENSSSNYTKIYDYDTSSAQERNISENTRR